MFRYGSSASTGFRTSLIEERQRITYFRDVKADHEAHPALQYFRTKSFLQGMKQSRMRLIRSRYLIMDKHGPSASGRNPITRASSYGIGSLTREWTSGRESWRKNSRTGRTGRRSRN
ncbi:hypothetical protein D7M11_35820 [Paenibacillus ginsengarvi]|uniref:Uncharacterized protein n=1 Tax=Paenibacillus ginsengarvi TaxID=400777 RepID=A0A3B0AJ98_9BACL|nr:hypothetical protein D7M11_35820 [Paenibacillus ginsengarvi]